ncbi:hypothetical protein L7F22_054382 [Adiantum nelumboides]|nr:hypothetical protein [Adiantum nelumboides]
MFSTSYKTVQGMSATQDKKSSPKTPQRPRPSFATALAAPNKANRIGQLQATLDRVMEENRDLKARLSALEAPFDTMVGLATDKVKEVEAKVTQAHTVTLTKVETCVKTEFREQHLQAENTLKVRIGGLPRAWDEYKDFVEGISFLNETLKPINVDYDMVASFHNKSNNKRTLSGHAILEFENKEGRLRLLQQSRLLRGTRFWIAEELTPTQLKYKGDELKKVHAARAQGKCKPLSSVVSLYPTLLYFVMHPKVVFSTHYILPQPYRPFLVNPLQCNNHYPLLVER